MRKVQELTRIKLVETAKRLFLENGIQKVTIQQIAKEAQIGEATVYRYFNKKINLVISAATSLSNDVLKQYFNLDHLESGYKTLENFYETYLYFYVNEVNYFKFLNEFDSFLEMESIDVDMHYQESIDNYKEIYIEAYKRGIVDKTVVELEDVDSFYYSTTLALLNLCKKVSKRTILSSDGNYDGKKLIENLIIIILKSLKR